MLFMVWHVEPTLYINNSESITVCSALPWCVPCTSQETGHV